MLWLQALILALQLASVITYATVILYAYTLPSFVQPHYAVYDAPSSAAARILLPAKLDLFPLSDTSAPATSSPDDVPMCGSLEEGSLPGGQPRWALPSDNSGLNRFAQAQVRRVCSGRAFHPSRDTEAHVDAGRPPLLSLPSLNSQILSFQPFHA